MEKFDKKKYLELVFEYCNLEEENKTTEQVDFKDKFIRDTVYEKYFYGEKIQILKIIERIKNGFKKIKNYDLEKIFLLGISENNTKYMLPLIEKSIFLIAKNNNYNMQNVRSYYGEDIVNYINAYSIYHNKLTCGEYLYDYGTMLGVFEEFKEMDYRSVNEEDEKSFIEFIKILENHKNYDVMRDKLYESDFFSIENGKRRKLTDEEIKEVDSELTDEEKEVYGGRSLGELINSSIDIFSIDYKRATNIINGLWVLGIIRTSENIDGTYDYLEMIKKAGFGAWFFEDEYTIDYETIKKYFGKYKLIREFCDSRETQKLEEEKDTFEKILPYLKQMKNRVEVNKDEAEKVLKEVPKEEVEEILEKVEKYLKDNEIGIIKFDTGGMRTREHVFGFFEENVGVEN